MNPKLKKILIIIGFIIIIIIIGLAIYFLFFQPIIAPALPPVAPVTPPPTGLPPIAPAAPLNLPPAINLPTALPPELLVPPTAAVPGPTVSYEATGGITSFGTLESDPVKNPVLATNGQNLDYYDAQTGLFYTITPDGQKTLLSDAVFKNVDNVTWAPNNQKAILEYPDGSNIVYDFVQKKSVTLPSHWKDFTFSNDSSQIAFKDMRIDPADRYLSVTDTNGNGYRQIERLGEEDANVHISWAPNDKYVALFNQSVSASTSEVYPIGFNGENYRKFTVEGRDFRFDWSPSGDKIIYSVFNSASDYKPSLWVVNTSPDFLATGRSKLEIDTWADKCTFASEDTVYCAVPQTLDTGSGFRPDFADTTPDDIYKINITTGAKELVAQPLFPSTIDKLIVSQDNKTLYWLEKSTGQIKKMNL